MAGVRVADSYISIEEAGSTSDGHTRYRYYIDTPTFEHSGSDLKSGVGNGTLQIGLASLLSFLCACAEGYNSALRTRRQNDNGDLFPLQVAEWAYQNSDELAMLGCELDETPGLITDANSASAQGGVS
jgi:hypothetical protein